MSSSLDVTRGHGSRLPSSREGARTGRRAFNAARPVAGRPLRSQSLLSRLTSLTLVLAVLTALVLIPSPVVAAPLSQASTPATATPGAGQIVVHPHTTTSLEVINARYQTTTLFQFTDSPAALVQTTDLSGTLALMARDPSIAWFEANNSARQPAAKDDSGADPYCGTSSVVTATTGTSAKDDSGADPHCTRPVANGAQEYANQWMDIKVNLSWAHKRTLGQGVTIAVLDTAVESHPALAGKVLPGVDLLARDPSTNVPTTGIKRGHGTFVAGVALHVAPGAQVLPVRVLNDDGRGSTSLVAEGIRQAAKKGARVINMSLSTPTPSRALQEAVAYAQEQGAILVAAYGNEGLQAPAVYPADFPNVLSVVATDADDTKAKFTNFGRKADVAAPGVNIVAPWRDGEYGMGSGTSYAAPVVSGQVALMLTAGTAKRQTDTQDRIIKSVDNIDALNGMKLGFGRINLPAALLR